MEIEMYQYNPHKAPAPEKWLAMDESERIQLIVEFHEKANIIMETVQGHSAIHAAVENQLAERIPEVVTAYKNLRAKKVDRHSTIHAIGGALAEMLFDQQKGNTSHLEPNQDYYRRLKKLRASDWKR